MNISQSSYFLNILIQYEIFFLNWYSVFAFILLVAYVYNHSYQFLAFVVPTGTYLYFTSFLWSMHSIKCQGTTPKPAGPFSLLNNFTYFLCALQRQWHTLLQLLSSSFLFKEVLYVLMFILGGSCCSSSFFVSYFPSVFSLELASFKRCSSIMNHRHSSYKQWNSVHGLRQPCILPCSSDSRDL